MRRMCGIHGCGGVMEVLRLGRNDSKALAYMLNGGVR